MDDAVLKALLASANAIGVEPDSREFALAMDSQDPVRHLRDKFHYPKMRDLPLVDQSVVNPDEDCVYFCGNSLGLCPKETEPLVMKEIDKWSKWGVYGHRMGELPWAECDLCIESQMARIVGAKPEEVALMNGLTVNLHLLMLSFYEPTKDRHKILLESKAFPSDHYAVESQIRLHNLDPETSMLLVNPQPNEFCIDQNDILRIIEEEGESIALVMLCGVQYYTGQLFNIPKITQAAHAKGILVGFDLAHAAGNVPLYLHDWDVDFACWCTYKYLCSGAGGISGAYIHERFATSKPPKLQGWWGHENSTRFLMDNKMQLIPGIQGYRLSNPSGLLCAALKAALNIYGNTTLEELHKKSYLLTGYLEWMIRKHFSRSVVGQDRPYVDIFTPSDPDQRGCQLSLTFSIPVNAVFNQLTAHGVVCDERHPSVIRVAPVHLYNSFEDVYRFTNILKKILSKI